ncbi:glycoside hydrolase superfamily [Geopyxis carbonaria]|nr:glycoside hydrolase superfamily [Geopyxis carbonaria]
MFTRNFGTLVLTALAVTQLAAAIPHGLPHHRRHAEPAIVTVTTTAATVYIDQYGATVDPNNPPPPVIVTVTAGSDSVAPPAPTPSTPAAAETTPAYAPAPAPEVPSSKSTPVAQPKPTTTKAAEVVEPTTTKKADPTTAPAPPAETTKAVAAPSSSYAAPKPSATPDTPASGKPGITYSPWKADPNNDYPGARICKEADVIDSEIKKLASFSVIRLYDGGCGTIESIIANTDCKLFIGVDGIENLEEELSTVIKAVGTSWDRVDTVNIGNEHIEFGRLTVPELLSKLEIARTTLAGKFTGPIVTVETVNAWGNNPDLCKNTDFVATNAHPYFAHQAPSAVEKFMKSEMANVKSKITANGCADKKVHFVEAGWPAGGSALDAAVPGVAEQKVAIKGIINAMGSDVILFSSYNEDWKPDTPATGGTEKFWGIVDLTLS